MPAPAEIRDEASAPPLPVGWIVSTLPNGSIDLQVDAHGRPYLVAVAAVVSLVWTAATLVGFLTGRAMPLAASPLLAVMIAVVLIAFTLWCATASECWRLAPGLAEHRVGWKRVAYVGRIEDSAATLRISANFASKWSTPYYRLYAIGSGGQHFLIERSLEDLKLLAAVIAARTGWTNES